MVIGVGTFTPGAHFGCPRAYINDLYVYRNGDIITNAANVVTVTDPVVVGQTATFVIHPFWWAWSSRAWILRDIIIESYYQTSPGGTKIPLPYNLIFYANPSTLRNTLHLGWSGLVSDPQLINIPTQNQPYWLPPLLP